MIVYSLPLQFAEPGSIHTGDRRSPLGFRQDQRVRPVRGNEYRRAGFAAAEDPREVPPRYLQFIASTTYRMIPSVHTFRRTIGTTEKATDGQFCKTEITAADTDVATIRLGQVEGELGIADNPITKLPYRDLVLAAAH
ncbi:hypothetical protein AB0L97_22730 [Nocardia sp. NPDC051911]|uniref:hypothetical protein n=1 Tax=Nocardia sp. NPDC051911 TaxID=3154648 RepID=UPI00342BE310